MKTQSAKAKGRTAQKELRQALIDHLGIDPLDIESRSMGASGSDLILSSRAREKFPFSPEVKNQERLNIWDAWKQAGTNAEKDGLKPILCIRRNRHRMLAVLDLEDFLCVLKQMTT